ncbi:flocculation protein [Rhynchospora pubera]|uniref:Flocculation protein n=1 Tax=Rhynchospora pubera TaxID=906938 RepID=A0AAV8CVG8_9POAL|nr:flocculation protein [Rhynchospora pubera]KAJ4810628.1 flocculation protein [Rhynchospora pubera]
MQPGGDGAHPPSNNGDGWIHGFLIGAERILNAVLGTDEPSSSSSSTSSFLSDEAKDENASQAISTARNDNVNQEKDSKPVGCLDPAFAVGSEIDSKKAIEQLLMEETFSREECNNLVDIIQSRVLDSDEQSISWEKFKTSPRKLGSSFLSPKFLSLGSSPYCNRDLEFTAVNEAKRWIDSKKNPDSGPCTLNTNLLEFDPQTGFSPVEVAKSYMHSLPQKDSARVLKRGCDSSASGEPPERTKRVKLALIEGTLDTPKFNELDVNSTVQSPCQTQASTGVNDTPILTAIPLDPSGLHVTNSCQTYGCRHNTDQLCNALVPYVTCAMDPSGSQLEGWVQPTETCSVPKVIMREDIITKPNTSRGTRGGRGRRGRGQSGAGNGVARNSSSGKTNDDGAKQSQKKNPTPRPRRGRGAKLKPAVASQ